MIDAVNGGNDVDDGDGKDDNDHKDNVGMTTLSIIIAIRIILISAKGAKITVARSRRQ